MTCLKILVFLKDALHLLLKFLSLIIAHYDILVVARDGSVDLLLYLRINWETQFINIRPRRQKYAYW
jgi:hypothetical protein